jgi:FtsP/CotA-like multicopper oxidase with cupredoxin domain
MSRIITACAFALSLPVLAQAPQADPRPVLNWDDRPGFDFDSHSTPTAPCGTGTPPRGHFAPEMRPDGSADGVVLTVRQDPNRLCYVADGIADAPVIRARQGEQLVVTLRNEITDPAAIGRYVPARKLDQPNQPVAAGALYLPVVPGMRHAPTGATNLHVHGFAVPPVRPQDEVMATCVDPAVGPPLCGQRAFTYRYQIPAAMPAGLYWYHPHVHGEVQAQMMMGLAGAIVVEGPDDDARRAAGIEDRIFVVRQTQDTDAKLIGQQPQVPGMVAPEPVHHARHPNPASGGLPIDTDDELPCSDSTGVDKISLNGAKVIDGRVRDVDVAHVEIGAGKTQLWRIVNAATDAHLNLAVIDQSGMPVPLEIVARDGAPLTDDAGRRLTPAPVTDYQLVPPAGRLEFLVHAPPAGQKAYLVSHGVDTGCAGDKVPERKLVLITPGAPANAATAVAAVTPATDLAAPSAKSLFSGLLARRTDTVRTLALAEYPRPGADDSSDFYIVERKPGAVLKPFMMNGEPTITTHAGAVEEWIVENWTNELHAFHIHQVHFRVLEINGVALRDPPLVDTVSVPYATSGDVTDGAVPVTPGRVRIKLALPEALAGDIPFHCHLVDHEDNGMMGVLRVLASNQKPDGRKSALPEQHSLAWLLAHPPLCAAPGTAAADRPE